MNESIFSDLSRSQLIARIEDLMQRLTVLEDERAGLQRLYDTVRESDETYRILLDESSDPIFAFYPDGTYRYVNKAFADGVGRRLDEITGRKIWDVFPQDEADKRYTVVKWVFANGETRVIDVRVPRPDGDRYYITTVKPIKNECGSVISVICISKEITERRRMEEELRRLSMFDILTNLYNRNFFETEVERIQDSRLFPVTVVMVDLNHLKQVNDSQGHAAGDELICKAARVLKETFRVEDIIARYGGDEFVVLLPQTGEETMVEVLERLRSNIARQNDPSFSLAIGTATGEKGCRLADVLRLADDRMYQEKAASRRHDLAL